MSRADLTRFGGRLAVLLGGEILQSLFHLGFNLALVRLLPARDYGLFAMVFVLGGVGLTVVRALAGVPAATSLPQARSARAAQAQAAAFGTGALLVSVILAAATAAGLAPVIGGDALGAGAFVGLWSLRSYLRIVFVARRRAGIAGASDLAFTLGGSIMGALLLVAGGGDRLGESFALLAAAHGLGIAAALALSREPVRLGLRQARRHYGPLRGPLAWSLAGVAVANLQAQGQVLLIGALAGPAAYAPIAACLVLFSPLRLLGAVVVNIIQPEMAAQLARGEEGEARLRRLLGASTAALLMACLVYGIGLALFFGPIQDRLLAGRFSDESLGLIAATVWLTVTVTMLYAAPKTLLETRRAFRTLAGTALASAGIGMGLIALLVVLGSPAWSMVGVALSEAVVLIQCWRALAPTRRRAEIGATAGVNR